MAIRRVDYISDRNGGKQMITHDNLTHRRMPPPKVKRRPALEERVCETCGRHFNVRGYPRHVEACVPNQERGELGLTPAIDAEPGQRGTSHARPRHQRPDFYLQIPGDHIQAVDVAGDLYAEVEGSGGSAGVDVSGEYELVDATDRSTHLVPAESSVPIPKAGDIVIDHHPHSKKGRIILGPEEYKASLRDDSEPTEPLDGELWRPFRSRKDFEFADLAHDGMLNRPQIESWIKFARGCQGENATGPFTIRNYSDLKDSLESASRLLTPVIIRYWPHSESMYIHALGLQFKRHNVECEFEDEKKTYETWCRPLWGWILDHLINPEVVRHFEWDAKKIFRYDGTHYTRIYTEPWTGNRFWDIQVTYLSYFVSKLY